MTRWRSDRNKLFIDDDEGEHFVGIVNHDELAKRIVEAVNRAGEDRPSKPSAAERTVPLPFPEEG